MPEVNETTCCGFGEISSVGGATLDSILEAVHQAKNEFKGMVFATTIPRQKETRPVLRKAGFEVIKRFRNPNSGNYVTIWMRPTKMTKDELKTIKESEKKREAMYEEEERRYMRRY